MLGKHRRCWPVLCDGEPLYNPTTYGLRSRFVLIYEWGGMVLSETRVGRSSVQIPWSAE